MLEVLDVVALLQPRAELGLVRGQVGTVVERYSDDAVEVEFSDDDGVAYALASFRSGELLKLVHEAEVAA